MKIFIPSYNRGKAIITHRLFYDLDLFDYKIIVHDKAQEAMYKANNSIPPERIICSETPVGISPQRQWIKDNLAEDGEWYCMFDDNVKDFEVVCEAEYNEEDLSAKYPEYFKKNNEEDLSAKYPEYFKKNNNEFKKNVYEQPALPGRIMKTFRDTIMKAEEIGAHYCGFATGRNYFFSRGRKWGFCGYVISKGCLIKKDDIKYDLNVKVMDDYAYTAENIAKYGCVVINRYAHALGGHYQEGGIGKYDDRLKYKIADCKYIMEKYPGLYRYNIKKTCHPEAELIMKFWNMKSAKAWKEQYEQSRVK